MKSIKTILILIAGVYLFQACGNAESKKAIKDKNSEIPVTVMKLEKEIARQQISTAGQFSTDDEAILSFKTGGIISAVLVKEGDYVREGQLLATLDLTEIKAQVSQAELGFEKAKRDFERAENLYKDSVATLEQYQNAQTALSLARQQLNAAKFNLSYSEIRAGANGYILKKFINAGQLIGPGMPVVLTNGAGKSQWVFKVSVSDKEWSVIETGDEVKITTDAAQGIEITGKVTRKSEGADPASGAFTIEIKIDALKDFKPASGLFGKAQITPEKHTNVWKIPYEALLEGNANKGFVFVTTDGKTAEKVIVTIASIENDHVNISEGLENHSLLITKGSAYLTDQSKIKIVE